MSHLCLFVVFVFTFFVVIPFFVFVKLKRTELKLQRRNDLFELNLFLYQTLAKTHHVDDGNDPTRLAQQGSGSEDEERDGSGGGIEKVKKKKRAKKKNSSQLECGGGNEDMSEKGNSGPVSGSRVKADVVCFYPFTSSTSATQRKIKKQYDELMKCNASKKLTLSQVGQFATCLVEARNELQHKADAIQRKFTIRKALLNKADRSSFDRLRKQICKLELEQKRLEEDASVYNWLQHQLKLSPAYKKMLEIACTELKTKSREQMESKDVDFTGISFEDFLAQEKKDSFWQKNMKSRSCSS
uniref:uncharacterized protein LOC105351234 isoform X1 n=1 Tax=Fragaria vesca subsp. vesca TaxID=101020 RepID=UPI0005C8CEC0|nr:PREDICTED: uncharacterized protein LOC105351234 isoform X1 [Fragaria vesca subsp. vesca]